MDSRNSNIIRKCEKLFIPPWDINDMKIVVCLLSLNFPYYVFPDFLGNHEISSNFRSNFVWFSKLINDLIRKRMQLFNN